MIRSLPCYSRRQTGVLSVSRTNAISIAVLSAVVSFSDDERISAVILLAFLVGIVQMGITLLRLGDLTRYISHAVIVGFTSRITSGKYELA